MESRFPPLPLMGPGSQPSETDGAALVYPGTSGPARFGVALGALVERLMQLALNTLSFLRVGAFALAHAALSQFAVIPTTSEGS